MIADMNLPVADAFLIGEPTTVTVTLMMDAHSPRSSSVHASNYVYASTVFATAPVAPQLLEQQQQTTYQSDRKVSEDGGDIVIPRSSRLQEEVFDNRGEIIRYNLPFNVVMVKESVCPLPRYQFEVPDALAQAGITLQQWKNHVKELITIAKLREHRGKSRYARWNAKLMDWQRRLNEDLLVPRGMFAKVISHQESHYDMYRNQAGGKHWLAISLTPRQSQILMQEEAMSGIGAADLRSIYCCHPYFGIEEVPMKLRSFFYKIKYYRRLRRVRRSFNIAAPVQV